VPLLVILTNVFAPHPVPVVIAGLLCEVEPTVTPLLIVRRTGTFKLPPAFPTAVAIL
jgi:hypothetical protein